MNMFCLGKRAMEEGDAVILTQDKLELQWDKCHINNASMLLRSLSHSLNIIGIESPLNKGTNYSLRVQFNFTVS